MCNFFKLLVICSGLMASCCSDQLFALQIEEVQSAADCHEQLVKDIVWDEVVPVSTIYGFSSESWFPSKGYLAANIEQAINFSQITVPFEVVIFVPFNFKVQPERLAHLSRCKKAFVVKCTVYRDAVRSSAEIAELLSPIQKLSMAGCLDETVNGAFFWERPCSSRSYCETKIGYNADS